MKLCSSISESQANGALLYTSVAIDDPRNHNRNTNFIPFCYSHARI